MVSEVAEQPRLPPEQSSIPPAQSQPVAEPPRPQNPDVAVFMKHRPADTYYQTQDPTYGLVYHQRPASEQVLPTREHLQRPAITPTSEQTTTNIGQVHQSNMMTVNGSRSDLCQRCLIRRERSPGLQICLSCVNQEPPRDGWSIGAVSMQALLPDRNPRPSKSQLDGLASLKDLPAEVLQTISDAKYGYPPGFEDGCYQGPHDEDFSHRRLIGLVSVEEPAPSVVAAAGWYDYGSAKPVEQSNSKVRQGLDFTSVEQRMARGAIRKLMSIRDPQGNETQIWILIDSGADVSCARACAIPLTCPITKVTEKLSTATGSEMVGSSGQGSFAAQVEIVDGDLSLGLMELVLVKVLASVDVIIGIDILRVLRSTLTLDINPTLEFIELDVSRDGAKFRHTLVGERVAVSARNEELQYANQLSTEQEIFELRSCNRVIKPTAARVSVPDYVGIKEDTGLSEESGPEKANPKFLPVLKEIALYVRQVNGLPIKLEQRHATVIPIDVPIPKANQVGVAYFLEGTPALDEYECVLQQTLIPGKQLSQIQVVIFSSTRTRMMYICRLICAWLISITWTLSRSRMRIHSMTKLRRSALRMLATPTLRRMRRCDATTSVPKSLHRIRLERSVNPTNNPLWTLAPDAFLSTMTPTTAMLTDRGRTVALLSGALLRSIQCLMKCLRTANSSLTTGLTRTMRKMWTSY